MPVSQKGGDKVISVEVGEYDETNQEFIKSSNGFEGSTRSTYRQIGASMTAQDEGDRRPAGYHYVSCRYRSDLPSLQDVGSEAANRTLDLMGGKKIATTTIPIIIENRSVGRVLSGLFDPMSAGNIQQKRSFLADKKGKIIGSKLLTLIDDPFLLGHSDPSITMVTASQPESEISLQKAPCMSSLSTGTIAVNLAGNQHQDQSLT